MANWEILSDGSIGLNVARNAQCPYCDFLIAFTDHLPKKCPDCAKELNYDKTFVKKGA